MNRNQVIAAARRESLGAALRAAGREGATVADLAERVDPREGGDVTDARWDPEERKRMGQVRTTLNALYCNGRAQRQKDPWTGRYVWVWTGKGEAL